MLDWVQFVLGALVLWAPGIAWTWWLVGGLDWAKFVALSVIVALTVQPALVYVLNVFFGVPVSPMNVVLVSLALTSFALAMALAPRLERAWA